MRFAGAAVNRPRERAKARQHRGVKIGAGAGDDARGEGRGVELVLGAGDEHAVERVAVSLCARSEGACAEADRHAGEAGGGARAAAGLPGMGMGEHREPQRQHRDDHAGLVDARARRQAMLGSGEARHHHGEPQQRRRVVADGRQRRDHRRRNTRGGNRGAQMVNRFGPRALAAPQQEADLLERGAFDQLLDWIAAIGELAFNDRADAGFGDDDPVEEPSVGGCATVTHDDASGSDRARTPRSGAMTPRNASISERR